MRHFGISPPVPTRRNRRRMPWTALLTLVLLAAVVIGAFRAIAADLPAVGTRTIGSQTYLVDRNGSTVGQLKELSPGNWHITDNRGMTVGRVQTPPGSPPHVAGAMAVRR